MPSRYETASSITQFLRRTCFLFYDLTTSPIPVFDYKTGRGWGMLNHQTPVQKQYKEDCRQESVICQVQVCKIGKYIFSTCWRIAGFAAYWEGEEMVRYRIEFLTICRLEGFG